MRSFRNAVHLRFMICSESTEISLRSKSESLRQIKSFAILNEKVNFEPWASLDLTAILPSNYWTMSLQMKRPSPMPCVFIWSVLFKHPNILKRFFCSDYLMPTPVSLTISTMLSSRSCTLIWICPFGLVNLIAFESKLRKTYWIRFLSEWIIYFWLKELDRETDFI